jgi:hypothetical protein
VKIGGTAAQLKYWKNGILGLGTRLRVGFPLLQHSIIPKDDFFFVLS